jgi:hypothetical protein
MFPVGRNDGLNGHGRQDDQRGPRHRTVVGWGGAGLFDLPRERPPMKSTRKGLREGELVKDTYERLNCAQCEQTLGKENPPDEIFSVRKCPDCGRKWKELR